MLLINHLKTKKMKKISLRDVKNGLRRDEMRQISGGCGGGGCSSVKCCWSGTSNCSTCEVKWSGSSCVSGATLTCC
jgi:hypothetical protein